MSTFKVLPIPILVETPERMLQVCREVKDSGYCGIDTETTGLDLMRDHVLFWSLSPSERSRYCITRELLPVFKRELAKDEDIHWIMTNANFDNSMLANSGVPLLAGPIHCTLVMDWLLDENRSGRHGLKETALDHLNLKMRSLKSVLGKKKNETYQEALLRLWDQDRPAAVDYASCDAWASLKVYEFLRDRLEAETTDTGVRLWDLFEFIEAPLSKCLYKMIRRGVQIDEEHLQSLAGPLNRDMDSIQRKFNKKCGMEININSPTQLKDVFFKKLGYEPEKMTPGGKSGVRQPSLDKEVLQEWAAKGCPYSNTVLEYRSLSKTKSTYVEGMIDRAVNSRIHPMLTQHVTVTGRLSSKDPNLQNITRPEDDPYNLRGSFIAKDGHTFVAADYRQLEMRLLAVLSGDERMCSVINNGWDIHMGTASVMYDVPYDEIARAKGTPKNELTAHQRKLISYRQTSKTIGFGQRKSGRSKTCSKRGNLSAMRKAIPCCATRRSVSTCDQHQLILNGRLVSIESGSHSRARPLTRQAKSVGFGIWHRLFASTVGRGPLALETARRGARSAVDQITYGSAKSAGIGPTRRRAATKAARRTTTGVVADLLCTTRRSHTTPMVTCVSDVVSRPYWFTTRTRIDLIATRPTSNRSANDATKLTCITAQPTCPSSSTPRRYSQCPEKSGIYTLNYGEGIRAMAEKLGCSKEEAQEKVDTYFRPYPSVKKFIEDTHKECRDTLYVSTILGRKRRLHDADADWKEGYYSHRLRKVIPERPGPLSARALRQAVNSRIQGSAASVARCAQLRCEGIGIWENEYSEALRELGVEQTLQVHDELIFEVPNENLEEGCALIQEAMETPFEQLPEILGLQFRDLPVPLDVDVGRGKSWAEAH